MQLEPYNPNQPQIQQPTIVYRPTAGRDVSQDVAAIIAANAKSQNELESVEYSQIQPQFILTFEHIGTVAAVVFVLAFIATATIKGVSLDGLFYFYREDSGVENWTASFWVAAIAGGVAFVLMMLVAVRQLANRTYYRLDYSSSREASNSTVAIRQTFRLEVQEGNKLSFIDLPDWFTDEALLALASHYSSGGGFNRRELEQLGICNQAQFDNELKPSFEKAALAAKNGKSWELTEQFFNLAEQVEAAS